MSDLTIPGVTSRVNSDKIIENLMKIERIPLERLEQRNETNRQQKEVWQLLNRKITLVRDSSRKLYSFQNPFDEKIVTSSDTSILTATATRGAAIENRSLKVIEIAAADRFVSNPIPRNEQVDPGTYNFFIGQKKISFNFRGGTIREFADMVNRHGKDDLRATTINYDRENVYFIIESRITGSDNLLSFDGVSSDFALKTGIMTQNQSSDISNDENIGSANMGNLVPANPASTASDAIIEIEGVRVRRPSNTVDDLIPEVTLNLRSTGSQNVELRVEPDTTQIKNSIIEFIGNYNDLIAELNILSRSSDEIINEITYFTEEERRAARTRMGLMQGETSITQIRDRLMRIMSASQRWNDDNFFTLLAEVGISTNANAGGSAAPARLRGYLEIDERRLDAAIENNPAAIKNLFGFDRDSDMVIDSGAAFEVDSYLRGFSETGGLIATRISTIDRNIARTDTEIANYNQRLVRIEQDLRRRYGIMEGALQELDQASSSLRNLNSMTPNNNSR